MIDPTILPKIEDHVDSRWRHLTSIVTETITEGLKYLTIVHLAGMGGVLSFMGATKTNNGPLVGAFACFFAGTALVGVCYFYRLFHFDTLVNGWITDTRALYSNDETMRWENVIERDRKRTDVRHDYGVYAAGVSFAFFLAGGLSGFWGVYLFVAKVSAG